MSPVIISRLYQLLYKWFEFELGELFKVEISTFFMVHSDSQMQFFLWQFFRRILRRVKWVNLMVNPWRSCMTLKRERRQVTVYIYSPIRCYWYTTRDWLDHINAFLTSYEEELFLFHFYFSPHPNRCKFNHIIHSDSFDFYTFAYLPTCYALIITDVKPINRSQYCCSCCCTTIIVSLTIFYPYTIIIYLCSPHVCHKAWICLR